MTPFSASKTRAAFQAYVNLSRGWALGSHEFKTGLVQDFAIVADPRALEGNGAREVKERRWSIALETALQAIQKPRADIAGDLKSAPWKLAVAAWLKCRSDASNRWLAENLNLGTPAAFSHNLTCFHRQEHDENPWSVALNTRSAT